MKKTHSPSQATTVCAPHLPLLLPGLHSDLTSSKDGTRTGEGTLRPTHTGTMGVPEPGEGAEREEGQRRERTPAEDVKEGVRGAGMMEPGVWVPPRSPLQPFPSLPILLTTCPPPPPASVTTPTGVREPHPPAPGPAEPGEEAACPVWFLLELCPPSALRPCWTQDPPAVVSEILRFGG